MKRIVATLLLCLASTAYALPNCPSDQSARWNNCFGTYTFTNGNKYVGEYKDNERHGQGTFTFAGGDEYVGEFKDENYHGQGTYTFADGTRDRGYWMNGEFVPDICEGMGLSKGTSEFGQCVLKLIDKL